MKKPVALIIVDDGRLTTGLRRILIEQGYTVCVTEASDKLQNITAGMPPDIIIAGASARLSKVPHTAKLTSVSMVSTVPLSR